MITHSLSGSGKSMQGLGYIALHCTMITRGLAGARLGRYSELSFLAEIFARFLIEFHADDYKSLRIPAITSSASSRTIHKLENRARMYLNTS